MKKKILTVAVVILVVALTGSGWGYTLVKDKNNEKVQELTQLNSSFAQQYGAGATITQMVSPKKVYAASWTGKDGITHISWNIGGLWVTVWNGDTPVPVTPATPAPATP